MKYILLTIFAFVSLLSYGQQDTVFVRYNTADYNEPVSYKTDTVLFNERGFIRDRDILIGTTVLPGTIRQQIATYYGLNLQKVTLESCQNDDGGYFEEEEIMSVTETEDKLYISIKIISNCCYSFLCDVEIIDDKTINLITLGYGAYCSCNCCFGLTFDFDILFDISEEKENYSKLESIIINGQEKPRRNLK